MIKKIKNRLNKFFYQPFYIFLACLVFVLLNLLIDGTLFQAFNLVRDLSIVENRIEYIKKKNQTLLKDKKQVLNPRTIEKKAQDRLDYSKEDDLIFIFPEEI